MILHAFRRHLGEELGKIPADAEQAFESYAVTTAALARRLLEYLAIDDLLVPNGFGGDPPSHELRTVLNRILHFRVLHQDAVTFAVPDEPDLVTLYSDRTQGYDEHLYIRLGDYRTVVGRLAHDDAYVAGHLLRRSVTLMNHVMRESGEGATPADEIRHAEFRKWVDGMLCNAWNLTARLVERGDVRCPELDVECYERRYGEGAGEYPRDFAAVSTARDLLEGYGRTWWWRPLTSRKMEIGGIHRDCMHLGAVRSEAERTTRGLVVTFDSFIGVFGDALRQLDGA